MFFKKRDVAITCNVSNTCDVQQPTSPVTLYACEDFTVRFSVSQNFRLKKLVADIDNNGVVSTELVNCRDLNNMHLSEAACRLRDLPNAGGNSVVSEVMSFEVLQKCFGAELLKVRIFLSISRFECIKLSS